MDTITKYSKVSSEKQKPFKPFTGYKKESSASHVRGPPVRSRQGMARGSWERLWRGRRRRFLAALSEKSKIAGVPVSAAMSTANDVSTVRFGRWWWCWRRRRRSTTCGPTTMRGYAKTIVLLGVVAVLCALLVTVDAAAKAKSDEPSRSKGGHKEAEPVIEEVNAKQLERLLNEKDFVAVYWCKCIFHQENFLISSGGDQVNQEFGSWRLFDEEWLESKWWWWWWPRFLCFVFRIVFSISELSV